MPDTQTSCANWSTAQPGARPAARLATYLLALRWGSARVSTPSPTRMPPSA